MGLKSDVLFAKIKDLCWGVGEAQLPEDPTTFFFLIIRTLAFASQVSIMAENLSQVDQKILGRVRSAVLQSLTAKGMTQIGQPWVGTSNFEVTELVGPPLPSPGTPDHSVCELSLCFMFSSFHSLLCYCSYQIPVSFDVESSFFVCHFSSSFPQLFSLCKHSYGTKVLVY